MTEPQSHAQDREPGSAGPWWFVGADGLPDVEQILGPDGMQAVGGVAEEALKLFVVLRERAAEGLATAAAEAGEGSGPSSSAAGGWGTILGQLASGAVQAVTEFAAAAGYAQEHGSGAGPSRPVQQRSEPTVDGSPCAYCPICQAIALFRSVPTGTWQRLAGSIVEAADAVADGQRAAMPAQAEPSDTAPMAASDPVGEFFAGLQASPDSGRSPAKAD